MIVAVLILLALVLVLHTKSFAEVPTFWCMSFRVNVYISKIDALIVNTGTWSDSNLSVAFYPFCSTLNVMRALVTYSHLPMRLAKRSFRKTNAISTRKPILERTLVRTGRTALYDDPWLERVAFGRVQCTELACWLSRSLALLGIGVTRFRVLIWSSRFYFTRLQIGRQRFAKKHFKKIGTEWFDRV